MTDMLSIIAGFVVVLIVILFISNLILFIKLKYYHENKKAPHKTWEEIDEKKERIDYTKL